MEGESNIPSLDILLRLGAQCPISFSGDDIKRVRRCVHLFGLVGSGSNEGAFREVHNVPEGSVRREERALREIRVINEEVSLRGGIQDEIALDPRLNLSYAHATLLEQPALMHRHLVPVALDGSVLRGNNLRIARSACRSIDHTIILFEHTIHHICCN
jgi:hypothetical protein